MPLSPQEEVIWRTSIRQFKSQFFSEPIELASRDFRMIRAAHYLLGLDGAGDEVEPYLDQEELYSQISSEYMLSSSEVDIAFTISEDYVGRSSYGEA